MVLYFCPFIFHKELDVVLHSLFTDIVSHLPTTLPMVQGFLFKLPTGSHNLRLFSLENCPFFFHRYCPPFIHYTPDGWGFCSNFSGSHLTEDWSHQSMFNCRICLNSKANHFEKAMVVKRIYTLHLNHYHFTPRRCGIGQELIVGDKVGYQSLASAHTYSSGITLVHHQSSQSTLIYCSLIFSFLVSHPLRLISFTMHIPWGLTSCLSTFD